MRSWKNLNSNQMKIKTFLIAFITCILFSHSIIQAQDKRPVFIGLQPSFTKETFYEENEFDINIVPLMVQIPIGKLIDFRITSEVNYRFGPQEGISDVGAQFVMPIYFKQKENAKTMSHGFYAGPVLGVGQNLLDNHNTITIAVEPGYMFKANKSFSLALGLQLGASYFDNFDKPNAWYSHFGFKINIGFWVNKR